MRHWTRSPARSLSRLCSLWVCPRLAPHSSSEPLDPNLLLLLTPTVRGNVLPCRGSTGSIGVLTDFRTGALFTSRPGSCSKAQVQELTCSDHSELYSVSNAPAFRGQCSRSRDVSRGSGAAEVATSATSTRTWRSQHICSYSCTATATGQPHTAIATGQLNTATAQLHESYSITNSTESRSAHALSCGPSGESADISAAIAAGPHLLPKAEVPFWDGKKGLGERGQGGRAAGIAPGADGAAGDGSAEYCWEEIEHINSTALCEILGASSESAARIFVKNPCLFRVPMRRTIRRKAIDFALLSLPLSALRGACETGPYLQPDSLSPSPVHLLEELHRSLPQGAAVRVIKLCAPAIFHMPLPLVRQRLARLKALGFADAAGILLESPHLLVGDIPGARIQFGRGKCRQGLDRLEKFLDSFAQVLTDELGSIPLQGDTSPGALHSATVKGTGADLGSSGKSGRGAGRGVGLGLVTGLRGGAEGLEGRGAAVFPELRRAVVKLVERKPNLRGTRPDTVRKVLRMLKSLFGVEGATQLVLRQPNLLTGKAETIAASAVLLIRNFGEERARRMLRTHPTLMLLRSSTLQLKVDLLTQHTPWTPEDVAAEPALLAVGVPRLQKRVRRIQSMGRPPGQCPANILRATDSHFERYLIRAAEEKPREEGQSLEEGHRTAKPRRKGTGRPSPRRPRTAST